MTTQATLIRADEHGQWSQQTVRRFKENPYNHNTTNDRFIVDADNFITQLGWIEFHITGTLISMNNEPMLQCNRTDEGIILLSGQFHDPQGNLVAVIYDNEWHVIVNRIWDVEFIAAKTLIVRSKPGEIILRMKITDNKLEIQQCFFVKSDLKLLLRGNDQNTHMEIFATGTRMRSDNERLIFPGPIGGINIV